MKELLFATHNANKSHEISKILGSEYKLLTLDDAGVTTDIPETADTLEGNALLKARFLYNLTKKPVFADDTGLEVDVLDGAPGVFTARYAGPECDPQKNMDKLLSALANKERRTAQFRTALAYIDKDGTEHLFEGICRGTIAMSRQGDGGFGYDPIFAPDGYEGRTFAQMPMDEKNKISHRGLAIQKFVSFLTK